MHFKIHHKTCGCSDDKRITLAICVECEYELYLVIHATFGVCNWERLPLAIIAWKPLRYLRCSLGKVSHKFASSCVCMLGRISANCRSIFSLINFQSRELPCSFHHYYCAYYCFTLAKGDSREIQEKFSWLSERQNNPLELSKTTQ